MIWNSVSILNSAVRLYTSKIQALSDRHYQHKGYQVWIFVFKFQNCMQMIETLKEKKLKTQQEMYFYVKVIKAIHLCTICTMYLPYMP